MRGCIISLLSWFFGIRYADQSREREKLMPIKIQNDLPVKKILEDENIFVMDESRAVSQDIRPLEIAILNLMPLKEDTELQLLRSLSNTPLQLNIEGKFPDSEFIRMTAECDAEIAKAQEDIDRLTDTIKQKKDVNDQMEQIRKILLLAQKSLSKENIDRSFVDQFIKRITVHIENPEAHENPVKMRLKIELNTGKSLEKSLIKTLIHRGQRSKKMIESYEKGLK